MTAGVARARAASANPWPRSTSADRNGVYICLASRTIPARSSSLKPPLPEVRVTTRKHPVFQIRRLARLVPTLALFGLAAGAIPAAAQDCCGPTGTAPVVATGVSQGVVMGGYPGMAMGSSQGYLGTPQLPVPCECPFPQGYCPFPQGYCPPPQPPCLPSFQGAAYTPPPVAFLPPKPYGMPKPYPQPVIANPAPPSYAAPQYQPMPQGQQALPYGTSQF